MSSTFLYDPSDINRFISGKYFPSFFEMQLDTNVPIDINNLTDEQLSTFLHEYIHFLQDILTTYGLYNIYAIGERILSCVHQITNLPVGDFDTPIDFSENNQDNVQLQFDVLLFTGGEMNIDKQRIEQIDIMDIITEKVNLRDNDTVNSLDRIVLKTNKGSLYFGAREICESMAYLIQKSCCKDTPKHYEFPYETAVKVASYYSPSFAKHNGKVAALCEMSLMSSNPGHLFVSTMKKICYKELTFRYTYEIYDHFNNSKWYDYSLKKEVTLYESYQSISKLAFHHLKEYYKGEPLLEPIIAWLKGLQKFSLENRNKSFLTFKEIMNAGCIRQNKNLINIINQIGGPLMKNSKGNYYSFVDMPDLSMLAAVRTIYYNIFLDGNNKCELYNWCKISPNNNATSDCYLKPWSRCDSEDTMCPFSILWRKWGLNGHNPV